VVRIGLLERVVPELGIEVWGYGAGSLRPDSPILPAYRGEAWGLDMYSVLAESKIVVNMHEAVAGGNANNMRLFEATGAGAMLLTDRGANLGELFEPGREVVTFDDAEDLIAKARHYLEHEDERLSIAAAGQARTLADHTYERRLPRVAERLERARASGSGD
jgi:spore maturation protein CgeB